MLHSTGLLQLLQSAGLLRLLQPAGLLNCYSLQAFYICYSLQTFYNLFPTRIQLRNILQNAFLCLTRSIITEERNVINKLCTQEKYKYTIYSMFPNILQFWKYLNRKKAPKFTIQWVCFLVYFHKRQFWLVFTSCHIITKYLVNFIVNKK